jgi:class 3 adenylate cyclase
MRMADARWTRARQRASLGDVRSLPSGTVALLFTDVEGSTRLLQKLGPDAYAEALAEHRRVLRKAFAEHGGVEVDAQGDSFFIAFPTAPAAVAAAEQAQAALRSGAVRVRMGLHTGTPLLTAEGYVGAEVHRAARIAEVGSGDQILLSRGTRELVDAEVRDLGEHRLEDLSTPERIFQLGTRGFPRLKTLKRSRRRPASKRHSVPKHSSRRPFYRLLRPARACQDLRLESLDLSRRLGDRRQEAAALRTLGRPEESLALAREIGARQEISRSLHALADSRREAGDIQAARGLYEECLALDETRASPFHHAAAMHSLADLRLDGDELADAARLYREGLLIARSLSSKWSRGTAWPDSPPSRRARTRPNAP